MAKTLIKPITMHTIRVKVKKGRSWIQKEIRNYPKAKECKEDFLNEVENYVYLKSSGIAITWSEGKKVHGVFRIN